VGVNGAPDDSRGIRDLDERTTKEDKSSALRVGFEKTDIAIGRYYQSVPAEVKEKKTEVSATIKKRKLQQGQS